VEDGAEFRITKQDIIIFLINMMIYLLCTLKANKILAIDMLPFTMGGSHLLLPPNIDSINLVMIIAI
jgi:hypothetical protein